MKTIATQPIEYFTIHSQKGGVGKTSIAIAIAGWSAFKQNKKTLIIDADLTGTSLIDVFCRESPSLGNKSDKPYLNELLLASPLAFGHYEKSKIEDSFCRTISNFNNIYYIPSSPVLGDIKKIVSLISQEDKLHFFQSRLTDIFGLFIKNDFKTIIVDNPPGLFGISSAMINFKIAENCSKKTIFITTPDPVDYRALIPSFSEYSISKLGANENNIQNFENYYFLFNKVLSSKSRDPIFIWKSIIDDLTRPTPFPDTRTVNPAIIDRIKAQLVKSGANAAPFIPGFEIEDILKAIQRLSEAQIGQLSDLGNMENWCMTIKEITGCK